MGRRANVAAAAMTVACCMACVMSRVLLTVPAARTTRDTHTWQTNSLSEVQQDEIATTDGQAPPSRLQQEVDSSVDDALENVRYSSDIERLLLEMENVDPEITPGLFQGDMMVSAADLFPMNTRVAIKDSERHWTNATVPYVISELYGSNERRMIHLALHTLDFLTCIKFVPWDTVADDYLLIWPMARPQGCWSFVGRRGGKQIVSLQQPDALSKRCFVSLGKPIHELLHALGMFHEQARPDRDDYIDIITENIIPRFVHNFKKKSIENVTIPFSYDYDSVMHYGSYFYSYNNKPTIRPKIKGATVGQRIMLSKLDCIKLNDLYGCLDNPFDKEKYTTLCTYLGY